MKQFLFRVLGAYLFMSMTMAQAQRMEGKIIKGYGETFRVENPDIKTDLKAYHKVIFDVSKSAEKRSEVNKYIETAARFLNMHAAEGMKPEQLKVAMTVHAGAWQDVLNDSAYKKRYGIPNPNSGLINTLTDAGVDIILCGQTMKFRAVEREDMIPEVKIALSAMTALLQYQNNGYTFIKF